MTVVVEEPHACLVFDSCMTLRIKDSRAASSIMSKNHKATPPLRHVLSNFNNYHPYPWKINIKRFLRVKLNDQKHLVILDIVNHVSSVTLS
jgi:hypothetical protein